MTDLRSQLQSTIGAAYTIERELGGGGMSRVFLAEETALGRKVVVKVLPPELTAGVNVDRFKREILVAARLQHAHIVPVLTAGETQGVPYYTMPFVEGESLRARIGRAGPLPMGECIGVLRDVARALSYAHERGVVHRDIKPDNVMLAGGSASVVDFGIAKAISASRTDAPDATLTQMGTSIGTPAYMAPEQAAGDPNTDHRADLYAFGCMAYEALTGRPPFTATSPHKLMAAHMTEVPADVAALRPETPPALTALVMRCLEKDPEHRPASAVEMVGILDNVTSGAADAMPAILLGGPANFRRALLMYAVAFAGVAVLTKAAILVIGLPAWVFPASMTLMGLGLPVVLFTGYVHYTTRRIITMTPQLTPGGTPSTQAGTMATLALKASPHVSWRRATLAGAYTLGAFVLLVGAFMVLRALGIGPAGSLLAAGSIKAQEPLLVTDFKVTNADTSLGRVLSDAAKTQLAASSVITILPPQAVADALRRMTRPVNATLDLALARELALRNGVRAIVDGEITGIGGSYIVTMKLVTTDSAKELASFRETASSAAGLIEAVDKLARSLRGRLGESLKRVNAAPELARATTGSLEALRKYTEGARAEDQYGKRADAERLLREAVSIDPAFAEAWRKLGVIHSNNGRRAQADSAFTQAYRYRDRVPENTRDIIIAGYYSSGPGRDRGKAADALNALLQRGETTTVANNLAQLLTTRREFARAESLYRAEIRLSPRRFRGFYSNLMVPLQRQQKWAAAESVAALGVRTFPDLKSSMDMTLLTMLYRRGDTATYRRAVDSLYTRGDSAVRVQARNFEINLWLLDGQLTRYRTTVAELRGALVASNPRIRLGVAMNTVDGWIDIEWLHRPADVVRRIDEALTASPGQLTAEEYLQMASRYATADRPDRARGMLARLNADVKDTTLRRDLAPSIANVEGDIAVAEGRISDAVAKYRESDRRPDGYLNACVVCLSVGLARAYDRGGMVDSALKYYEHYVTTYDYDRMAFDPIFLAPTLRRIGEIREQKGDKTGAAKYYQQFVGLWRNADPVLQPQVAEVKRRLSLLADVERH